MRHPVVRANSAQVMVEPTESNGMTSNSIQGHVLLLEGAGTDPTLSAAFQSAGFRVSIAQDDGEVLTATEKDASLTAIVAPVIDAGSLTRALTDLRHRNPHIPVFAGAPESGRHRFDCLLPGVPVDQIVAAVRERLDTHYYDERIVEALVSSTKRTLSSSVDELAPEARETFIRYDVRMLGEVTAMLDIMGTGLVGKVMVSGPSPWFEFQSRALLGVDQPNQSMISDMAAEISNVVAADVRRHYLSRGLDSVMGTPTVFGGSDVFVRIYSPRPSLVVRFESSLFDAPLFVEWLLERKGEDTDGEDPMIESGELEFF